MYSQLSNEIRRVVDCLPWGVLTATWKIRPPAIAPRATTARPQKWAPVLHYWSASHQRSNLAGHVCVDAPLPWVRKNLFYSLCSGRRQQNLTFTLISNATSSVKAACAHCGQQLERACTSPDLLCSELFQQSRREHSFAFGIQASAIGTITVESSV